MIRDIGGQRGRGMTRKTITYIKGHWWCWKTMGCIDVMEFFGRWGELGILGKKIRNNILTNREGWWMLGKMMQSLKKDDKEVIKYVGHIEKENGHIGKMQIQAST